MKEKVQKIIKVILGVALGVFIGRSLWLWQDVQSHPDLYAANSAPWYTRLLVEGVILAAVFLMGGVVWLIVNRRAKK